MREPLAKFYEVKMKNGLVAVLSNSEIKSYKRFVEEVRKEINPDALQRLTFCKPLKKEHKELLGIE